MAKRGATLEDKYLGAEPNYHGQEFKTVEDINRAYHKASNYFNYYHNAKSNVPVVLLYAEKVLGYNKKDIQALKKVDNWKLNAGIGNNVRVYNSGVPLDRMVSADGTSVLDKINAKIAELLVEGKSIVKEIKAEPKKPVITPAQRMRTKVVQTIMGDFDEMVVDKWMDGEFDKIKFPAYSLLSLHKIKGAGINMFLEHVKFEYDLVSDAYNKTCDQAVEAYSHISKGNKKKMMTLLEKIIDDINRLKTNNKTTRVPRAAKPKSSDVQVKNLKYKADDIDAKLTSINPVMIPGKETLYVYNVKNRKLTMYKTNSTKGFEVSGTTIKNICETSKTATLRKPDEILPLVLNKTMKQIDKQVWDTLTTKISVPNGRINADCILLRVL